MILPDVHYLMGSDGLYGLNNAAQGAQKYDTSSADNDFWK